MSNLRFHGLTLTLAGFRGSFDRFKVGIEALCTITSISPALLVIRDDVVGIRIVSRLLYHSFRG